MHLGHSTSNGTRGKFLSLIQGLIVGGLVKIHINGQFSEPIPIEQGVCQACPIAPMLFTLCTQPLLTFLQAEQTHSWLLGVRLGDSLHICELLFADDLGVLIPASAQAFQELEEVIHLYEGASGAKLNIQKSSVLPIGLSTIPQWLADKGCTIHKSGDILKYLSAPLGTNIPPEKLTDFCLDRLLQAYLELTNKAHLICRKAYLNLPNPSGNSHIPPHVLALQQKTSGQPSVFM